MTDEELAEELLERLKDFSPASSVGPGEDDDQVVVEIVMSRSSRLSAAGRETEGP